MSTDIGPAFKFAEWKRFVCNKLDEKTWTPDTVKSIQIPERWPHQEAVAKWVYVFQTQSKGPVWVGEYYVDGLIYPVDLTKCRGLERSQRPRANNGTPALSLATVINDVPTKYYAYVSRIQLPLKFIQELEQRAPELLLHMDAAFCDPPNDYPKVHQLFYDLQWFYRAVDPFTVALALGNEYRDACDDLIGYTALYLDQPARQAKQVRDRQNKKLIAEALVGILESDPDDVMDTHDNYSPTGKQDMFDFLEGYKKQVETKSGERDRRAAQLCFWSSGQLFDFAKRAHLANDADIPAFLNVVSQSVHRLVESTAGKALLGRWIIDETHWIYTYVLPQRPVAENVFQVGRKAGAALASLWADVGVPYATFKAKEAEEIAKALLLGWSNITRIPGDEMTVSVKTVNGKIFGVYGDHFDARIKSVTVYTSVEGNASWINWLEGTVDAPRVKLVRERFLKGVEIINFALSLKSLVKEGVVPDDKHSAVALVGMVGSTTDLGLMLASNAIKESYKSATFVVGAISASVDIICGAVVMEDAAQQHDYSAFIGGFAVVAGGLMSLGGAACAAGVIESTTVVGLPMGAILCVCGGIAAFGGWVLIAFGEESAVSLFVSHCVFGANYNSLGNTEKPWSCGPFRGWVGRLDLQTAALFNIISSFTLEGWNIGWLRVYYDNAAASSRFDITFVALTPAGAHRPECSVRVGPKTMAHTGGDPLITDSVYLMWGDENGRHYFQILPRWPDHLEPPGWVMSDNVKCTVRLDLTGDGSYLLPNSAPVEYTIIHPTWGVNETPVSSENT